MNKKILISILSLSVLVLVSACSTKQSNQVEQISGSDNIVNGGSNDDLKKGEKNEEDLGKWISHENVKMGIGLEYPESCMLSGMPDYEISILCSFDSIFDGGRLSIMTFDGHEGYESLSLEESINTFYSATKIRNEKKDIKNGYLSEINKIKIDNKDFYYFNARGAYCFSIDNQGKCRGGGLLSENRIIGLFENYDGKKFEIMYLADDPVAKKILETIKID